MEFPFWPAVIGASGIAAGSILTVATKFIIARYKAESEDMAAKTKLVSDLHKDEYARMRELVTEYTGGLKARIVVLEDREASAHLREREMVREIGSLNQRIEALETLESECRNQVSTLKAALAKLRGDDNGIDLGTP